MNEKEVKDRAEAIVEALTDLSLGKEPSLLSSEILKKLGGHQHFENIKTLYCSYLTNFSGKVNTANDIKALFDFRLQIVELYESIA